MTFPTLLTLVAGGDADAREAAIASRSATLQRSGADCVAIIEGLPSHPVHFDPAVQVTRIAPGCPCCSGNLTMQVTLNRTLRRSPTHLFIGITDASHLEAVRDFLTAPPYDKWLTLNDDLLIKQE